MSIIDEGLHHNCRGRSWHFSPPNPFHFKVNILKLSTLLLSGEEDSIRLRYDRAQGDEKEELLKQYGKKQLTITVAKTVEKKEKKKKKADASEEVEGAEAAVAEAEEESTAEEILEGEREVASVGYI